LNFFPLPHGHGWFRPVFPAGAVRCFAARDSPVGVVGFPYSGNGGATAQDLFRPRIPPEPLRGHFKPCRPQLRVVFSAILQRHLKVLASVEQGLRHRETLVELPDRSGADGIHKPPAQCR